MTTFTFSFKVRSPLQRVAEFHQDSRALKRLTPPPVFVQLHQIEPLAEGSRSFFTMWVGPIPLRWAAVHSNVDALHGFTDTQESGPLQSWIHTHRFEALDAETTLIKETITYSHKSGWRGILTQIMFAPVGLRVMFTYRAWVTRRACR